MSTSRLFSLTKVAPSKALLITSMDCEEKAAHVRNAAVDAIENGDHMQMGYRYLQSRRATLTTKLEAGLSLLAELVMVINFVRNGNVTSLFASLFYLGQLVPNVHNHATYSSTEDACGEMLTQDLGIETFKEIQKLSYSKQGLDNLMQILFEKNLPAIEMQKDEIELIPHSIFSTGVSMFMPESALLMAAIELVKYIKKQFCYAAQPEENYLPARRFN